MNSKFLEDNESYISTKPLKVYCGTYNVNGKVENDEHRLLGWLETGLLHEAGDPDVFAVGMQEIVDLSAGNVVLDGMSLDEKGGVGKKAAEEWLEKVRLHKRRHSTQSQTFSTRRSASFHPSPPTHTAEHGPRGVRLRPRTSLQARP